MSGTETMLVLFGIAALVDRFMRLLEFLEGEHEKDRKRRRAAR